MTSNYRKTQLVELAEELGSKAAGTKSELIDGIREALASNPAAAASSKFAAFVKRPVARARAKVASASASADSESDASDVGDLAHLKGEVEEAAHEAQAVVDATEKSIKNAYSSVSTFVNNGASHFADHISGVLTQIQANLSTLFAVNFLLIALHYVLIFANVRADPKHFLSNQVYYDEVRLLHKNHLIVFAQRWLHAALPAVTEFTLLSVGAPLLVSGVINFTSSPVDPLTFALVRGALSLYREDWYSLTTSTIAGTYALYGAALR